MLGFIILLQSFTIIQQALILLNKFFLLETRWEVKKLKSRQSI